MPEGEHQYGYDQALSEAERMSTAVAAGRVESYSEAEAAVEEKNEYDPQNEYHVDIESPEAKERAAEARELFREFAEKYTTKFDISNETSIGEVYDAAVQEGIFDKAKDIREYFFGRDISFYGVEYLWDQCNDDCQMCGWGKTNRAKAKAAGTATPERRLTEDEAVIDAKSVLDDGHTHLCILTGSAPGPKLYPRRMNPYLTKIMDETADTELAEIILNIPPQYEAGFRGMAKTVAEANARRAEQGKKSVALQYRVFQETYNKEAYKKLFTSQDPTNLYEGGKWDYDFRYESQARAMRGGFDNVGLGVLFGLYKLPLEEVAALQNHFDELTQEFGKQPARVCLPSANELTNIQVDIPHFIQRGIYKDQTKREGLIEKGPYEKFNELVYALTRLALPTANIVSSERDPGEVLEELDKYATCSTLNVHPGVGENAQIYPQGEHHGEQATVFPRGPQVTIEKMRAAGYNPILEDFTKPQY